MSIIESVGPSTSGRPANRAREASSSRFALPAAPEPGHNAPAETLQAVGAGLLVLQELGLEPPQDRAARRHGHALLAALTRLQRQLLGAADLPALEELTHLIASVPDPSDPALAAALHAVVLRARVELARRGR